MTKTLVAGFDSVGNRFTQRRLELDHECNLALHSSQGRQMLSRLIYASKALAKVDYPLLQDINDTAVRRNSMAGITGLLIYGQSCFLQVLEGGRAELSATFIRISHDKRHHELVLIGFAEIAERSFQDWAMRVVMIDGIHGPKTAALVMRFGGSAHFEPALMPASNAHGLLVAHSREFVP